MANFAIGSMVRGNVNNGHTFTSEDCLLEVTATPDDEHFDAIARGHLGKSFKKAIGEEVTGLTSSDFHVATEADMEEFRAEEASHIKEKALDNYQFRSDLAIKVFPSGKIESTFNSLRTPVVETDEKRLAALNVIIDMFKGKTKEEIKEAGWYEMDKTKGLEIFKDLFGTETREKALDNMINFFREFEFEPNFRFINTLSWISKSSLKEGKEYIENYFDVANNSRKDAIVDKIKSPEFKEIMYNLSLSDPKEVINERLKIYYGSQGTGKTTRAIEEAEGRCIVCNNSMLPQDLLEDFAFSDGKPGFKKSTMRECMEKGKMVVMDEFNLLPFETIRFLQGLLDGKKQIDFKGETINIKKGFGIIGTMNLIVNGMAFGLPEPLVDRASVIKKSQLTAKDLMGAL